LQLKKSCCYKNLCPRFKTIGEILYLFDKKFSHAVNKNPMAILEFNRYLRTVHLVQPTTTLIEKSPKIVNTFPDHLLYARVDGIIINKATSFNGN
jgi:hypothetical protein